MSSSVSRSIRSCSSSRSYMLYFIVAVLVTLMITTSPSYVSAGDVACAAAGPSQECEANLKHGEKLTITCISKYNDNSPDQGSLCKKIMPTGNDKCDEIGTLTAVIPGATETGSLPTGWVITMPGTAPKKDILFSYLCNRTGADWMRVKGKFESAAGGSAGFGLSTGNLPFIVSGAVAIVFAFLSFQ